MKRKTILGSLLMGMVALGCLLLFNFGYALPAGTQPQPQGVPASETDSNEINLERHFQELGLDGSIVIYDQNADRTYESNSSRNRTPTAPLSTFKIFNAMVALETGVIPDDVTVLTWDGVVRDIEAWNHDTNLRQGFANSTVWFYQVLARRAGPEQMQQFISQVGYGNQQIGNPEQIDSFWLEGPLQITPIEQIEFLQKLYRNDLPFSQPTIDLVKDIMIYEQTPAYTLRGKTGWQNSTPPGLGWFVGYLEQQDNVYYFATRITPRSQADAAARVEVTRRCLQDLGLL